MATKVHIFNPLGGPVVYSSDGHILGGGEHREIDKLDKHGEHCVANGYLVIMDDAPETADGDAGKDASVKPTRRKANAADSGASEGSDGD